MLEDSQVDSCVDDPWVEESSLGCSKSRDFGEKSCDVCEKVVDF